jgi:hypothetical protein
MIGALKNLLVQPLLWLIRGYQLAISPDAGQSLPVLPELLRVLHGIAAPPWSVPRAVADRSQVRTMSSMASGRDSTRFPEFSCF